jgi:hypothetical protein
MNFRRRILPLALALLAVAALRDCARLGDALPWRQLYDFQDFYCAGGALDQHADPYHYEPLHRCEHGVNQSKLYQRDPNRAIPAPLPAYDFVPFMLVAHTSFSAARAIDAIAILAAVAGSVVCLAMADIPLDVAALALALSAGYVLLGAGQVIPFALLALVLCGLSLARRRDAIAGVSAAFTLIEPHLGLPVCAAVMLWVPASRPPLLATGAALTIVAAVTVGIGGVAEYVLRVLPAQAGAEASYIYQYSLTYLLRTLGAAPSAALPAGELSYGASALAGLWLGGRLSQQTGRRDLVAYLPAAFSVFGGPYVHMVDLSFALPAALVLATQLHGRLREVCTVALCLLAVPWIAVWITKKLFLASLFVVATILVRLQVGVAVSIVTFCAITAAIYRFELSPPALPAIVTASFSADDLAQRAWQDYVAKLGAPGGAWLAIKLPTWAALSALAVAAVLAALPARAPSPRKT